MIAKILKKGDTIGIISPSSILRDSEDIAVMNNSIKTFEEMGYLIEKGEYYLTDETGYGTTAKHKAYDMMKMFLNPKIKAIFSITGGDNCISLDEYLDYDKIKNNPKIFCGFSDTTSLLNLLNSKADLVTFMGPSFKSISSGETDYRLKSVIDRFIENRDNLAYEEDIEEFEIIRQGKAIGKTIGGNLSLTTDLISGIKYFDEQNKTDVIIIGRGGGSREDLYVFNDEQLARAIFKSKTPIISAVGHETDFTICDFVSDERAPTPSAAAEIATPSLADLLREQDLMAKRMTNSINNRIILEKHRLRSSMDRFSQYADRYMLGDRYIALDMILDKIDSSFTKYIQKKREEMNLYGVKMSSLNPFSIFDRGYSIAEKEGRIVSTIRDIDQGDKLKINLKDGKLDCQVVDIEANDK